MYIKPETKDIICNSCGKTFTVYRKENGAFPNRKICDNCAQRPEFIERKCKNCGCSFLVGRRENDPTRYKNNVLCDNCAKPAEYRDFICKGCKKLKRVFRYENDFKSRIYCEECKKNNNYDKSYLIEYWKNNNISEDGKYKTITCEKCGKSFQVGRSNKESGFFLLRRFCDDCQELFKKTKKEYVCKNCGKTIESYWKREYCDYCAGLERSFDDYRLVKCKKCGKEFKVTRKVTSTGQFHGFKSRTCCDECNKKKTYTKVCPVCNKEFTTVVKNQITCSWDCSCKQRAKSLKNTTQKKWGVDYPCLLPQCKCENSSSHSKVNQKFENKLDNLNIVYKSDCKIGRYFYDIVIENEKIAIEINPTFTHSTIDTMYPGIDKNYHKEKTQIANENGYRCINVWDWDNWDKIIDNIKPKQKLYARKLQLKEITKQEANQFLDTYHLQNSCYGNLINLGLYQDEELIQVMTFGKPRYNPHYQWELLRLCTHSDYYVVGGAERLFKHFVKTQNPDSVLSYCDFSKFTGDVYTRLGFKQITKPQPRKHWNKHKSTEHITSALLLQKGYDNIFGTDYGKGTDNEQLMIEHNWLPIYDCGQINFVWQKENN